MGEEEERKLLEGICYGSFEDWRSQGRLSGQDRVRRTENLKNKFQSSLFQETKLKLKWNRNCVSSSGRHEYNESRVMAILKTILRRLWEDN